MFFRSRIARAVGAWVIHLIGAQQKVLTILNAVGRTKTVRPTYLNA